MNRRSVKQNEKNVVERLREQLRSPITFVKPSVQLVHRQRLASPEKIKEKKKSRFQSVSGASHQWSPSSSFPSLINYEKSPLVNRVKKDVAVEVLREQVRSPLPFLKPSEEPVRTDRTPKTKELDHKESEDQKRSSLLSWTGENLIPKKSSGYMLERETKDDHCDRSCKRRKNYDENKFMKNIGNVEPHSPPEPDNRPYNNKPTTTCMSSNIPPSKIDEWNLNKPASTNLSSNIPSPPKIDKWNLSETVSKPVNVVGNVPVIIDGSNPYEELIDYNKLTQKYNHFTKRGMCKLYEKRKLAFNETKKKFLENKDDKQKYMEYDKAKKEYLHLKFYLWKVKCQENKGKQECERKLLAEKEKKNEFLESFGVCTKEASVEKANSFLASTDYCGGENINIRNLVSRLMENREKQKPGPTTEATLDTPSSSGTQGSTDIQNTFGIQKISRTDEKEISHEINAFDLSQKIQQVFHTKSGVLGSIPEKVLNIIGSKELPKSQFCIKNNYMSAEAAVLPLERDAVTANVKKYHGEKNYAMDDVPKYSQSTPLIQVLVDKYKDVPLLGLQYVVEVRQPKKMTLDSCYYICVLCSVKLNPSNFMSHIKSIPHSLKFSKLHCSDVFAKFGSYKLNQFTEALIKEFIMTMKQVETKIGRQNCAVAFEKDKRSVLASIKQKITNIKGPSLVLQESVKKHAKHIPSNNSMVLPPSSNRVLQKPVKEHAKQIPLSSSMILPPRIRMVLPPSISMVLPSSSQVLPPSSSQVLPPSSRMVLPPSSSMVLPPSSRMVLPPSSRMVLPPSSSMVLPPSSNMVLPPSSSQVLPPSSSQVLQEPVKEHAKHIPPSSSLVQQESTKQLGQHIPPSSSREQQESTKQLGQHIHVPPTKYENFKQAEMELVSQHQILQALYAKEPGSHPLYKHEWKSFWDRKCQELVDDGRNPAHYDFTIEWSSFWHHCVKRLMEADFTAKRNMLIRKYNIQDTDHVRSVDANVKYSSDTISSGELDKQLVSKMELPPSFAEEETDISKTIVKSLSPCSKITVGKSSADEIGQSDSSATNISDQFSVIDILSLLVELSDQLESFGPAISYLIKEAIECSKKGGKPIEIFKNKDNIDLVRYAQEKLLYQSSSGTLSMTSFIQAQTAIEKVEWLLLQAEGLFNNDHLGLDIPSIARVTLGKDNMVTAEFIAQQLLLKGKTDASEEDLQNILFAVTAAHAKMKAE